MDREAFLVNPARKKRRSPKGFKFIPGKGMVRVRKKKKVSAKKRVTHKRKEVKTKMARKSTKRSRAAKKAWRTRKAGTSTKVRKVKRTHRRKKARKVRVIVGKRARGHVRIVRVNRPKRRKMRKNYGELLVAGANPKRRRHRNPMQVAGFDFIKNLPLIATGAISATAQVLVPKYLGVETSSPMVQYGVKIGTIAGGGFVLGKYVGSQYAYSWMLAGSAVLLADILRQYVLGQFLPSMYPTISPISGIGAFPYQGERKALSAYPGDGYSLEGAYSEVTSPYDN